MTEKIKKEIIQVVKELPVATYKKYTNEEGEEVRLIEEDEAMTYIYNGIKELLKRI